MGNEALSWLEFFDPRGVPYAALIVLATALAAALVKGLTARLSERFANRRLVIQQTGALVRFTLYLFSVTAAALTLFNLERELLLAIGGTLAVAFGFAGRDLAASVLAGVTILLDRPFQVGDRVTFDGHYGDITSIGLRSVRLVTLDDTQITIPNNNFLTDSVASANAGAVDMMVEIDLLIGIDQDVEEARRLLREVLTTSRYVNLNRRRSVSVREVISDTYFATRVRARAYVHDLHYENAFVTDVTMRAREAFREAAIRPPSRLQQGVSG
jgi:small-conductance mechanosensitive channel